MRTGAGSEAVRTSARGPFNYYVTLPGGGGGGRPSVTLCDRGEGGSAERYVTPKCMYMYNVIFKFLLVCMFIYT